MEKTFKEHAELYRRLAKEGQNPKFLFIGCSDSRVVPEFVTSAKPGEYFVIRNAGNFVPKYNPSIPWDGVAATIQYAIEVLKIEEIIVCGHSDCGAITAIVRGGPTPHLIQEWLQFGEEAKIATKNTGKDPSCVNEVVKQSVLLQLDHLNSFPFIRDRDPPISVQGWFVSIGEGLVEIYDPTKKEFIAVQKNVKL